MLKGLQHESPDEENTNKQALSSNFIEGNQAYPQYFYGLF